MTEKLEWKISKQDKLALRKEADIESGTKTLLAILMEILGAQGKRNGEIWDDIMKRYKIPAEYRYKLIANCLTGLITVKE